MIVLPGAAAIGAAILLAGAAALVSRRRARRTLPACWCGAPARYPVLGTWYCGDHADEARARLDVVQT